MARLFFQAVEKVGPRGFTLWWFGVGLCGFPDYEKNVEVISLWKVEEISVKIVNMSDMKK